MSSYIGVGLMSTLGDIVIRKMYGNETKWEFVDGTSSADSTMEKCEMNNNDNENCKKVSIESVENNMKNVNITQGTVQTESMNHDIGSENHEQSTTNVNTKNSKRKKAKKKNRNRANSAESTDGSGDHASANKHVHFGNVEEILFSRDIGFDVVPSKGLNPLGFGTEEGRQSYTVDQYTIAQQLNLRKRAQNIPNFYLLYAVHENVPLETRQYDYCGKVNPLFHSITEEERILLMGPNLISGGNDTVKNQLIVEHNRDIKLIRASREDIGCSCKPIKIDKLSISKMKQELLHSSTNTLSTSDINNLSRTELMSKLKETLICELCINNNCKCVQLGIECHINICGCMRSTTRSNCSNPYGNVILNQENVKNYRSEYIIDKRSRAQTM